MYCEFYTAKLAFTFNQFASYAGNNNENEIDVVSARSIVPLELKLIYTIL